MDADYSIELGPSAPALELPWSDPEARVRYLNLRREPTRIDELPEVDQYPALRAFLLSVNSPAGLWQSAKCDVWHGPAEAVEDLYDATCAHGSYIDIVLAAASPARDNFALHEAIARRIAHTLEEQEDLAATVELVVRRCYFHREDEAASTVPEADSDAGYCLTLFVTGWGNTADESATHWAEALDCLSRCLLAPPVDKERALAPELS